ncbi:unnamed protein product [Amoebophrya sp. A25]|nr:unnamed protein product [Amoebophrya sp. A25]|eukprot:GSA25T00016664001.1
MYVRGLGAAAVLLSMSKTPAHHFSLYPPHPSLMTTTCHEKISNMTMCPMDDCQSMGVLVWLTKKFGIVVNYSFILVCGDDQIIVLFTEMMSSISSIKFISTSLF